MDFPARLNFQEFADSVWKAYWQGKITELEAFNAIQTFRKESHLTDSSGVDFLYAFASFVFTQLGITDWRIGISDESFCDNELKRICLAERAVEGEAWYYIKQSFLHEVAHIGDNRQGSVVTHDGDFFRRFGVLCMQFADCNPKVLRRAGFDVALT